MTRTVVQYIDTAELGGTERALLILLSGLDRRRWQPVLFYHDEPALAPLALDARKLDVPVRVLPRLQGRARFQRVVQFIRALRAERPAVFHAHLNWPMSCRSALLAASAARTPAIVATQHLYFPVRHVFRVYIQRLVSTCVDRYIAVSAEVARGLRQNFGVPEHKITVVRNGISLTRFEGTAPGGLRDALTRGADRPIVLTIARLTDQKGHDVLLEAATHVPEGLFVLAGDGPLRPALEQRARQLGIERRIIFLGQREDVPELLAAADLFVLPSLYEGLPLSVLEAMAAGTPVIATAIGGTDEAVIDGSTGLLVPPRDARALAGAIQRLLGDPPLARRLAEAGLARVYREFAGDKMASRVSRVYDSVLQPELAHAEA
jgi:glycosyltransferase involved in cell wall biosynthesis